MYSQSARVAEDPQLVGGGGVVDVGVGSISSALVFTVGVGEGGLVVRDGVHGSRG